MGRLKESNAAILIGRRTLGAGCGVVDKPVSQKLKHTGLTVKIPNCARYMRSGLNEVAGIAPDLELPDYPMGSIELTAKLKELLEKNIQ